jgi:hypothetical protein
MLVIDTNTNCEKKIAVLRKRGVGAVGRYYAPSLAKRLTPSEARALSSAGIAIFTVYEKDGDPRLTVESGRHDAKIAAEQAMAVGQPQGSAIYFALEHLPNGYDQQHLTGIQAYCSGVRAELAGRWQLGLYSDGVVLKAMMEAGLCDFAWLSASRGFPGSRDFYRSGRWVLAQQVPIDLDWDGISVDTNEVSGTGFGAFKVAHLHSFAAMVEADNKSADPSGPGDSTLPWDAQDADEDESPASPIGFDLTDPALSAAIALANDGAAEPQSASPQKAGMFGVAGSGRMEIDWQKAAAFYTACITCRPRIIYGLGKKIPGDAAVPGVDFTRVDCSGFVRAIIRRSTSPKVAFPDGSVVQHDWVKAQGFATSTIADAAKHDGVVRIAFMPPQAVPSRIGHVALIHNGMTLESHGSVGPNRRLWDGSGWQAKTKVYILDGAA